MMHSRMPTNNFVYLVLVLLMEEIGLIWIDKKENITIDNFNNLLLCNVLNQRGGNISRTFEAGS